MTRYLVLVLAGLGPLAAGGCRSVGGESRAALETMRQDMQEDVSDTLDKAGQQLSRTWSDIWHDWNYTEQDGFADMRSAAGP